jgi:hypothetical protein
MHTILCRVERHLKIQLHQNKMNKPAAVTDGKWDVLDLRIEENAPELETLRWTHEELWEIPMDSSYSAVTLTCEAFNPHGVAGKRLARVKIHARFSLQNTQAVTNITAKGFTANAMFFKPLANMAMGFARGVLMSRARGTTLERHPIPLFDSRGMLPSEYAGSMDLN